MKRQYLIMTTITAVAVLILASSVPAVVSSLTEAQIHPLAKPNQSASPLEYPKPPNQCPCESYNKIFELYEEGWSKDKIAEELGFPLDIVTKYLKGEYISPVYPEPSQEPSEEGVPKKPVTEEPMEQQQRDLPAEDSTVKFVTVEIPGYGCVTVQEDMVVRDGDEIKIVANKDYKERGLITPVIERLPDITYVPVETPYGPLQVPEDTLEREGKEKIIATHVEFMKQLEELKKIEKQIGESDTDRTSNTVAPTTQGGDSPQERAWFHRRNVSHQPNLLYGRLDPRPLYNTGQNFTSYHEREIYLSNRDAVEFISQHWDTGERNVWVAVWDNWEWQMSFQLSFTDIDAPIEYYLIINSAESRYDMWLRHTRTGEWRYNNYYDNDDFSNYISYYAGSTELFNYLPLSKTFKIWTDIRDTWTRVGSTWYRPNEIFYFATYSEEKPYVEVNASWDANGLTYTEHETEYPNPGDLVTSQSGTLSGTGDSYTFSVSGLPVYTVVMAGNENADFDLYAKWDSQPTTSDYDARGYSVTSLEYFTTCNRSGRSGTLYIMVRSYSGSGHWECWVISGSPNADSGRKTGHLSGTGSTATYSVGGFSKGYAFNSGPDGSDFDLYIKWNSPPTTSNYDARGYSIWAQEIAGPAPGSGTLYFMVRSYSGSGEYATVGLIF